MEDPTWVIAVAVVVGVIVLHQLFSSGGSSSNPSSSTATRQPADTGIKQHSPTQAKKLRDPKPLIIAANGNPDKMVAIMDEYYDFLHKLTFPGHGVCMAASFYLYEIFKANYRGKNLLCFYETPSAGKNLGHAVLVYRYGEKWVGISVYRTNYMIGNCIAKVLDVWDGKATVWEATNRNNIFGREIPKSELVLGCPDLMRASTGSGNLDLGDLLGQLSKGGFSFTVKT